MTLISIHADEGMWILGKLDKQTRLTMRQLGLELSAKQLYNPRRPSLKDAVVSFGGYCSGVVVSKEGLVFTNHHCGFSSIQQHANVEHDYLQDGFVAHDYSEELPNPGLYVRFLLRQEDVTRRVMRAVKSDMSEEERAAAIDSVRNRIADEVVREDASTFGSVDAYYAGNEFWLSVYRDYTDVRLVFAPPSSVGKFGWDTDNWEWPRHTGDFSVFRIYADKDNHPADYSPDNVPYHPAYVAPVSLDGYKEGSFCMTFGYPAVTERYLTSFGIEEQMTGSNMAEIDVRGVKQAIWKREMEKREDIRIMYATKYDESSNYWKNSIGVNEALERLHVLEKKRGVEQDLQRWIESRPQEESRLEGLIPRLDSAYRARRATNRARAYFVEAFFNGPEIVRQALSLLNLDVEGGQESVLPALQAIFDRYDNLDPDIDKEVFAALIDTYRTKVAPEYLPDFYQTIDTMYGGNTVAFTDSLYARSVFTTSERLKRTLERDTTYQIADDPAIDLSIDLISKYLEMNLQMRPYSEVIDHGERLFNSALRRMYVGRTFYPDANATLRLSFGTVCGYNPFDGAVYDYYTTTRGILEKVRTYAGDSDFAVQPELLSLLKARDFGRYADEKGEMNVCFISNNDITGGNSGSAMFNARGELLGLAFDGNWEAMSSNFLFEPDTQRCIGVDVRYILFLIEKYGKASRLIEELNDSLSST
ncbi:MAG: S46 family peptidase [Prevotellaceae bacterium]|nr:S46 family peptidase [Prevotellaceae bacterium]